MSVGSRVCFGKAVGVLVGSGLGVLVDVGGMGVSVGSRVCFGSVVLVAWTRRATEPGPWRVVTDCGDWWRDPLR